MSSKPENFTPNRLRSSNITVTISISLVLFLIGIFGMIILNAQKYSDYIKQQLVMELYLKKNYDKNVKQTDEQSHLKLLDSLKTLNYIVKVKYINQETASEVAKKELGIDTHTLFEEDIFPASIEIALKSDFVEPQKVEKIKKELASIKLVDELKSDERLMVEVYENISKISFWIIAFAILFTIIAIILINNSIKLKIYAKRFIIKTMQLVGAKRSFILSPFLKEAFLLGILGSFISLSVLFSLWYYFTSKINQPFNISEFIPVALIIFTIGILITVGSTLIVTWKYLHLKRDQLFYN